MLSDLLIRIRALFHRDAVESELDDEMRFHFDQLVEKFVQSGVPLAEASRRARLEFGGFEQVKEECREARGTYFLEALLRDFRYALRQLRKNPGFACVAILILSLGIGGVTAIFSTLYTVTIRPLPYSNPDRLVLGRATFRGQINPWVAGPDYVDYRDKSQSFSSLEAFSCLPFEVTTITKQAAERTTSGFASAGLFPALGVKVALGRPFTADEGKDGGPPVAIVSYAYWQKHFGSKSGVAESSLVADGTSYDIVGVTPPDFQFIQDVDLWLPLRPQNLGPRRYNNWFILGRLRDGVTLSAAQSEVDVIAAQLEKAYPDTNSNKALLLTPLQGAFNEQYRSRLALLCGGAAAILLIAWANAAGLLLARGAGRQGELALRTIMGASRWSVMRLLLCEAFILAGAAGVIGTTLAVAMQNGLLRLMPIETLLLRDVGLSLPVLAFVLATTVLTGFGFGLLPALRGKHTDLAQDLRSSGRGVQRQGVRLRGGLVAAQVTVSFILLIVAGLLIRSFTSLHRVDPGFDSRNLLSVEVPLPPNKYPDVKRTIFFASLLESVGLLPGVISAAAINQLPLRDPANNVNINAADSPPTKPMEGGDGYQRVVLPGYFKTMGIPLIAGRDIEPTDTANSRRVVIISQQLAQTIFPKRDPLGQKVVIDQQNDATWEVVGVVGDVKQDDLHDDIHTRGSFYRAYSQQPWPTMRLAIRTSGDPLRIVTALRSILQNMDADIPLSGPRTMEDVMANSSISEKALTACLTAFSLLAVVLAAVGIYGLLAYVVTRRTGEFGIRLAMGAQQADVIVCVLREGLKIVFTGIGLGLLGAVITTRLIASQLYGVSALDPVTFIGVALGMVVISILACYVPARRAAGIDPMAALRCE